MAGYSGATLAKKLGIKEGFRVALVNPPQSFEAELGTLPAGASILPRVQHPVDLILFFAPSEAALKKRFKNLATKLNPAGMLWVAWPKKSAGFPTDLSFAVVQKLGLDAGLVDTKICAVNEVWSGLKFVYRIKDRRLAIA